MADENDPDGLFDEDPTPVNSESCSRCGRRITRVIPCDVPRGEVLLQSPVCIESPGRWCYCTVDGWAAINMKHGG